VLLGRKQEALRSIELLGDPAEQVSALLQIAELLRTQGSQENEWHELLTRAIELVLAPQVLSSWKQAEMLRELGKLYAQAQQWEQAGQVISSIEDSGKR